MVVMMMIIIIMIFMAVYCVSVCLLNLLQTVNIIIARVFPSSPTAGSVGSHSSDFSARGLLFPLAFSALTVLVWHQKEHLACKN